MGLLSHLILLIDTFPEKLMTKNMEQQKRIQYFTSIPFTPEISIATRGDGWLSSADMEETRKRRMRRDRIARHNGNRMRRPEGRETYTVAWLHVRKIFTSRLHWSYNYALLQTKPLLKQCENKLRGTTLTSSREPSFKLCSSFLSFSCWRNINQKLKLYKTCSKHRVWTIQDIVRFWSMFVQQE